jgi:diamine N-acetyltransferase
MNVNMVTLRPATSEDKRLVFEWLTSSDLTSSMLGQPDYPDTKIPTWQEFDADYLDHYFDGSAAQQGQSFIILCHGIEVGAIHHNEIDPETYSTDLDIWLKDSKYTGKGIGAEAIRLLCDHLRVFHACQEVTIAPSRRNSRAIKAYEKAGFQITDRILPENGRDYIDSVVMVKRLV